MPRPLGTSAAADTLQQRARFFGYKASYLGTCRVFLQASVAKAFT
ncbi:Z1 domain-containing protein, partial [Salmonella enterica]